MRDALHRQQLTDLLKADFNIAARNPRTDAFSATHETTLRHYLHSDTEALIQLRGDVLAAHACRIADRGRTQQRLAQRFRRCDIGLGRASANGKANDGAGQFGVPLGEDESIANKLLKNVVRTDDEVGDLAALEAVWY